MRFNIFSLLIILSLYSCHNPDIIDLSIGPNILKIEVAATDIQRSTGLMNRDSLDENRGMIFVFEKEQSVSFWMKNTRIPLSVAYISKEGKILEIYNMKAQSLEPVPSKRSSILYALEVNKGYFEHHEIKVGDIIDLDNVNDYLNSSK